MENESGNQKVMNVLSQPEHVIPYSHHTKTTIFSQLGRFLRDSLEELNQREWLGLLLIFGIAVAFFLASMFTKMTIIFLSVVTALTGTLLLISSQIGSTRIHISSQGIKLPGQFQENLKGKLLRPWNELNLIMFARAGSAFEDPEQVVLGFTDNSTVELDIDGFTRDNLEKLLMVINTFNPNVRQVPEAALDKLKLDDSNLGKSALCFTGLWKEELSGRFGSTTFIPLEQGAELNDRSVKVLGQVAFGGLSAIYVAQSKQFGTVIVKEAVLPGSMEEEVAAKALEMFQREAQILSRIDHPRIARVFDYFVENGRHYMLLEYIEGRNLRAFIQQEGTCSEAVLLDWAKQLAEILKYLHGLDPPIIHRDLTPSNLILEKDGALTLIDFGAANSFIGTATGTVVGKSSYIPMEQFKGKSQPASDYYALGCSLFYFLTGADPKPFSESDVRSSGIEISDRVNEIIKACTRVDPNERISDFDSLTAMLKSVY